MSKVFQQPVRGVRVCACAMRNPLNHRSERVLPVGYDSSLYLAPRGGAIEKESNKSLKKKTLSMTLDFLKTRLETRRLTLAQSTISMLQSSRGLGMSRLPR